MAKLGPSVFNKFLPDASNSPEFLNSDQKMEYRRKTRRGKKKGKHHRGKFIDSVMDISIESSKCVGCKRKVEEKRDFYSNLSKKLKMCDKCRKLFPPQQLWSNDDCMLALTEIAERDDQPCQQRPHSVMDHCTNTCEFDWKDSLLDLPLHFDEIHELMCLETDSFNNYRVDDCTGQQDSSPVEKPFSSLESDWSFSLENSSFDLSSSEVKESSPMPSFEEFLISDFETEYAKCKEERLKKLPVSELISKICKMSKRADYLEAQISQMEEMQRLKEEHKKLLEQNIKLKNSLNLNVQSESSLKIHE